MSEEPLTRHIDPEEKITCASGRSYTMVIRRPRLRFVLDGHSHIQSGACCPLPLVWVRNAIARTFHFNRSLLNFFAPMVMGSGGRVQRKKTEEIAAKLVGEIQHTCEKKSPLRKNPDEDLFPVSFIMPMDMDFAHIAGFSGSTIYHESGRKVICYERKDAFAPENKGRMYDVSGERPNRVWVYQAYWR